MYAVGYLHVFQGPDDIYGYGYLYVHVCWTDFGMPANVIEEYMMPARVVQFLGLCWLCVRTYITRAVVRQALPTLNCKS